MKVSIEFEGNTKVVITADNGEVYAGQLYLLPCNEDERQSLIDSLTGLFNRCDNLGEVQQGVCTLADRVAFGIQFSYIVPPSEAKRKAIGAAIKKMRESKGYSARQFAFLIQMDPSNYARIESGKHSISVDTLNKIAFYLDAEIKIVPREDSVNAYNTSRIWRYE